MLNRITDNSTAVEVHQLSGGKPYVLAFTKDNISIFWDCRVEYSPEDTVVMWSTAAAEAIALGITVVLFNPRTS